MSSDLPSNSHQLKKYCDGDIFMSVSFRVMLYFLAKSRRRFRNNKWKLVGVVFVNRQSSTHIQDEIPFFSMSPFKNLVR